MLRYGPITFLTVLSVVVLSLLSRFFSISFWWVILPLFLWFVLTVIGSFHIRWNYHLNALHKNDKIKENHVAITFDDGPNPEFTPQVIQLLEKYNAKATFFCIGNNMELYPELLHKIIESGNTVGNHTYSHSNKFGFFGTKRVVSELQSTIATVENLAGKKMKLYRPAFGVTNPNIKRAVYRTGLQAIGWSIRSLDTTSLSEEAVLNRITRKISKGDVVLLHDTSAKSVAVLEQLLLFLQKKNFKSVTADQLLQIEAYA